MSIRVECKCGTSIEGQDVGEVVALTQSHDETCKRHEEDPR